MKFSSSHPVCGLNWPVDTPGREDLVSLFLQKSLFLLFHYSGKYRKMPRYWTLLTYVHTLAGPLVMLMYPLYASIRAIESTSKVDDEQWLAYWIVYSFLTLVEMVFEPVLAWIPIWYEVKLGLIVWLALPQFRGAAFIYERYVREQLKKYSGRYEN
ncbi:hypothetical protein HHK36_025202 [Tetracentron sinense]|uniref:HVA22-like protein n=1 Tax=Tetracentron sinense TaxID=13715 RepID=A0A834YPF2_TETSI|nr:hypothetical protein HHK36_025202 [Tetracentron sinense]